MPARLVSALLLLVTVPLFCQQGAVQPRVDQWVWSRGKPMRPDSPPELDTNAILIRTIQHDATELSSLNAALQSNLHDLQKGMMPKDLAENLKKVEKLSKKLRQEVTQ